MITNHHIASLLVTERQRDLRAVRSRPRWRLAALFGRRAELQPVPPGRISSDPGANGLGASGPVLSAGSGPELRGRRGGPRRRGAPDASAAHGRTRITDRTGS